MVGPAERLRRRWADLAAVLVIVLAAPGMLYPLWDNPTRAGEDDVLYCYPLRAMVGQALREGRWPVHNELEATGGPLLADPQAATMFPLVWLSAVMDLKHAYAASIFASFAIAGLGTWVYLRAVTRTRSAALLGALAFMFCGFMVGHRVHLTMIQTAAFFPWGLWAIERIGERPGRSWAVLTAVFWLSIVAGHWAILVNMALGWGVYLLLRARPLVRSVAVLASAALLAVLMAAPQVAATAGLYQQATRRSIGYLVAGENSFFPLAGILWLFPLLMGTATPGFYPQKWWGSWHLSEMLPYVGLVTLVLAGAAVVRLALRPARREDGKWAEPDRVRLARCWAIITGVALLWAIGMHLPTYRLIYHIPVLGVVRCPARMLLLVDMGLAVLAAMGLDLASDARVIHAVREAALGTVRRAVRLVLPGVMVAGLLLMALGAAVVKAALPAGVPGMDFFVGGARDAWEAVDPANPAVWVPLALLVVTVLVVRWWTSSPQQRSWALVALLAVDLFSVVRFVDIPPAGSVVADPEVSAAGDWLRARGDLLPGELVWGISPSPVELPAELLLPKVGQSLGFGTLGSYGAWHSGQHAHLFGFDTYGHNVFWEQLVRRNHLLSLYGVRYLLASQPDIRRVIESVRVPDDAPPPDGPNLLGQQWSLLLARQEDGLLRLKAMDRRLESLASQPVTLEGGQTYRIGMDVRGPEGGAAFLVKAEVLVPDGNGWWRAQGSLGMEVQPEQTGEDWRHFEWVFVAPGNGPLSAKLIVHTQSERPVEVRNVTCCRSSQDQPADLLGRLGPGEEVYELAAMVQTSEGWPVAIYRNRLIVEGLPHLRADSEGIERLRWMIAGGELPTSVPDVSLKVRSSPAKLMRIVAVPAAGAYLILTVLLCSRGRGQSRRSSKP